MDNPFHDQDRAAAREWGLQAAIVWREMRRTIPFWLAARMLLAWARDEGGETVLTVSYEEEEG
jgi:TRAP-type mannitol/chloroaromatic compound transport system substrate-binding protein